jgi:hypothetical protein
MAATPFLASAEELAHRLQGIRCRCGHTQITRVLAHAIDRHAETPLAALVLVGDACEEPLDLLAAGTGAHEPRGMRVFALQEGADPEAARTFATLARLTGGAHVPFDADSPDMLRRLLEGVAACGAPAEPRASSVSPRPPSKPPASSDASCYQNAPLEEFGKLFKLLPSLSSMQRKEDCRCVVVSP